MNQKKHMFQTLFRAVAWGLFTAACSVLLLVGLFYYYTGTPVGFIKFFRTLHVVEQNFPGAVDKQDLLNGALEGIVKKLGDKHSIYLDGDDFQAFSDQTSGSYAGIGVYIGSSEEGTIVAGVMDDSPAAEAGVQRGDLIQAINGTSTKGMSLEDISKTIRGPVDTTVTLTLGRNGESQEMAITRRQIHMKTVGGQMIEGTDVGYIRVAIFSENTGEEFTRQYQELRKQGMKRMILDLRNNPGGIVDQAVAVASNFVPKDSVIVSFTSRSGDESEYKASGSGDTIPLVVLINENSASASEIVSGAIQDLKLGPVIGTKSYGKGTVQGVYPIDSDDAIKLTVAKYRTASGREIDGVGIQPDIEVQLQPNDPEDYQYEKALEVVQTL
ncbi:MULTISPECIES: S41 family peptidase [unclassified Megasphaera]|uniref:S41 family peptidase n=1 Tax=unclassified Megasphaera TaxID=2626256 RepID=UPI0025C1DDFE|nr:S41 family peptidase [Megasphaera sp. UBA4233]